jgi:hypothetical protein
MAVQWQMLMRVIVTRLGVRAPNVGPDLRRLKGFASHPENDPDRLVFQIHREAGHAALKGKTPARLGAM